MPDGQNRLRFPNGFTLQHTACDRFLLGVDAAATVEDGAPSAGSQVTRILRSWTSDLSVCSSYIRVSSGNRPSGSLPGS